MKIVTCPFMIPLFAWFAERLFINVALRSALNFPELFWFGCQVQDVSRTIGDRTAVLKHSGGMTGEQQYAIFIVTYFCRVLQMQKAFIAKRKQKAHERCNWSYSRRRDGKPFASPDPQHKQAF